MSACQAQCQCKQGNNETTSEAKIFLTIALVIMIPFAFFIAAQMHAFGAPAVAEKLALYIIVYIKSTVIAYMLTLLAR